MKWQLFMFCLIGVCLELMLYSVWCDKIPQHACREVGDSLMQHYRIVE